MRILLFIVLLCISQSAHAWPSSYYKYSYDGKYIAMEGESSCSVALFEAATGNEIYSERSSSSSCELTLAFTRDSRFVLLGSILFDINAKKKIDNFYGDARIIDYNSKYIAFVTDSYNQVKILDLKTLKTQDFYVDINLFFGEQMTFSPDSKYLIHDTGYPIRNPTHNVYRVKDLKLVRSYGVENQAFSPNGQYIFSEGKLIDSVTGKELKDSPYFSYTPGFSKDGKTMAAADGGYHLITIYNLANFHELARVPVTYDSYGYSVENNKLFITTTNSIDVWDIEYTKKIKVIPYSADLVDFSPDGNYFVTNLGEVISVETGKRILNLGNGAL